MQDLVRDLRVIAGMISMGEQISWGSDSMLMEQAADEIEALRAQVNELRAQLNYFVSGNFEFNPGSEYIGDEIDDLLERTPAQCLAEVRAQAYKEGFEVCIDAAIELGHLDNDIYVTNQIRQQAKGEG